MLRKLFLSTIFVVSSVFIYAQSNIDMTYPTPNAIVIDGKIILNIYPSTKDSITIKGTMSISAFSELSLKEKKGELVIRRRNPFTLKSITFKKVEADSMVLNLYIKNPNVLEAKSNAEINFKEKFILDSIDLKSTNSASISALVEVAKSNLKASNSAKILISGKSPVISLEVSGKSYINTIQVECDSLKAVSATSGECYVKAGKLLNLKAITYGSIYYKGIAEEIVKTTVTFGKIESF